MFLYILSVFFLLSSVFFFLLSVFCLSSSVFFFCLLVRPGSGTRIGGVYTPWGIPVTEASHSVALFLPPGFFSVLIQPLTVAFCLSLHDFFRVSSQLRGCFCRQNCPFFQEIVLPLFQPDSERCHPVPVRYWWGGYPPCFPDGKASHCCFGQIPPA